MKTRKTAPAKKLPSGRPAEWDNPDAVTELIAHSNHPLKPVMTALRKIILAADPQITEGIKWNAPSFFCHDWFATFHVRRTDHILIVFHRGAKPKPGRIAITEDTGLLEWLDERRCIAKFFSLADVKSKQAALQAVVRQWAGHMARTS
ncbi:MAG: DUF1801 domain-containing protein [Opitutae bacterium]|nr:DUF1801 domain-containing protein [Opitutae bacterium]